jgi:hypothetical protein
VKAELRGVAESGSLTIAFDKPALATFGMIQLALTLHRLIEDATLHCQRLELAFPKKRKPDWCRERRAAEVETRLNPGTHRSEIVMVPTSKA